MYVYKNLASADRSHSASCN